MLYIFHIIYIFHVIYIIHYIQLSNEVVMVTNGLQLLIALFDYDTFRNEIRHKYLHLLVMDNVSDKEIHTTDNISGVKAYKIFVFVCNSISYDNFF